MTHVRERGRLQFRTGRGQNKQANDVKPVTHDEHARHDPKRPKTGSLPRRRRTSGRNSAEPRPQALTRQNKGQDVHLEGAWQTFCSPGGGARREVPASPCCAPPQGGPSIPRLFALPSKSQRKGGGSPGEAEALKSCEPPDRDVKGVEGLCPIPRL